MGCWILNVCIEVFLERKLFSCIEIEDTSKKSVSMRFVSIKIDSSSTLNQLIMYFFKMSSFGSLALCNVASPLSLYIPSLLVPKRGLILFRRYNLTSLHTSVKAAHCDVKWQVPIFFYPTSTIIKL